MHCTHCGIAVAPTAAFCSSCGGALPASAEGARVAAAPQAAGPGVAQAGQPSRAAVSHAPAGIAVPVNGSGATAAVVIVRLLTSVAILTVAISSLFLVENPDETHTFLTKHLLFLPPINSESGYKAELIILIVLAGLALLSLPVAAVSRVSAPIAGLAVVGILIGNYIAFPDPHSIATYLLAQPEAVASWVCCGLGLMCAGTVFIGTPTAGRVVAVCAIGAAATGIAAAIIVGQAPNYGSYFNYGESQLTSSDQVIGLTAAK